MVTPMTDRLAALTARGVSLCLDDLSRQRLHSGNLKHLIDTWHISGVTTNQSIFQAALKDGASYQHQLDELAARGATVDDTVRTYGSFRSHAPGPRPRDPSGPAGC
jgi:transaldolase